MPHVLAEFYKCVPFNLVCARFCAQSTTLIMILSVLVRKHFTAVGSDEDYNSNPFNITINAGATEGRANISVTCDNKIEGLETFSMRLSIINSSPEVILGGNISSEGCIIDSSGKLKNIS